jgi:hypothetical protein
VAVADGAGGTGIYCGEWANFLLDNLPIEPITTYEAFLDWFGNIIDPFLAEYEPNETIDGHIRRRFYEEGSSCTLAVVWHLENKYHWLTYGDSHIFFLKDKTYSSHPYQSSSEFEGTTHLLNWMQAPNQATLLFGEEDAINSNIILATDAMSKHIFLNLEQKIDSDIIFTKFQDILMNERNFIDYIKTQTDIEKDDYSLITWTQKPNF